MKEFIEKLIKRLNEKSKWVAYGNRDRDIGMTHKVVPFSDISDIVNELTEEFDGEELRKSQKIYSFIKREINPYGKPFDGTVYEFGLKVMKYIENLHTEELAEECNNDFCEWKVDGVYLMCQHKTELFVSCLEDEKYRYKHCPICGKKIKAVE